MIYFIQSYARELRVLARLDHVNVLRFHGYMWLERAYCIVLQMEETPLRQYMARPEYSILEIVRASMYLTEICSILLL